MDHELHDALALAALANEPVVVDYVRLGRRSWEARITMGPFLIQKLTARSKRSLNKKIARTVEQINLSSY